MCIQDNHKIYSFLGIKIKFKKGRKIKGYVLHRKREIHYKIKRFLALFCPCKKYDFVIPIGMNCNFSEAFLKYFRFSDSTFWNWVYAYNCAETQIQVMDNPSIIFSQGAYYKDLMWNCQKTNLRFHGRTKHNDLLKKDGSLNEDKLQEDLKELNSRIEYLHSKTQNYINSDKKKLFVYTLVAKNKSELPNCIESAKTWHKYLSEKSKNFDFLIVCARQYYNTIKNSIQTEQNNIYIRKVKSNYEKEQVLHLDIIGWADIFKEFRPKKIIKTKNKKLKYDEL